MPKIGAHVSTAGGLEKSFIKASEIGAECTQFFISPPQQWAEKPYSSEELDRYIKAAIETKIGPNFIHAIYLTNLASANSDFYHKSISWLIYAQKVAENLKISGTILHIGSSKDRPESESFPQVITALKQILASMGNVKLILENSAGAGNLIGDTLEDLGNILQSIPDSRLKICLDTQHLFASGYDLQTKQDVEKLVKEIGERIGLEKLEAIHINDSKTELGSHRDRHENLGKGLISLTGFKSLINHSAFQDIPFILEVPGLEKKGPDKENLDLLRSLLS